MTKSWLDNPAGLYTDVPVLGRVDIGTESNPLNAVYASTIVTPDVGTLAATGSTQTDAAAVVTAVSRVTAADGTKGVKLPALSTVAVGQVIEVINSDVTNALKLYSDAAGELLSGQAGTTAISIAAKVTVRCRKYDATNWYVEKGVTPY